MRAVAFDFGQARIGMAISDPLGLTAQPLTVVKRTTLARDFDAIRNAIADRDVTTLVVGLPLNMDGSEGPAAKAARAFGDLLAPLGLPVEYVDERLTTVMAEAALLEADMRRAGRRDVRDKVAAVLILQTWLDSRANPPRA
jgi:putative Holliday junction resolvase